ncbi:hypothetical protein LJC40_01680 [Synergistaceae bacterium OttesenSCG-928-D05]|nr:hypothetical protein [Synergistaceae bacterium OttesenSCG-928-D05]
MALPWLVIKTVGYIGLGIYALGESYSMGKSAGNEEGKQNILTKFSNAYRVKLKEQAMQFINDSHIYIAEEARVKEKFEEYEELKQNYIEYIATLEEMLKIEDSELIKERLSEASAILNQLEGFTKTCIAMLRQKLNAELEDNGAVLES